MVSWCLWRVANSDDIAVIVWYCIGGFQ
uniref:Uncharacterized protein n=1 Tax=Anguilla anguilla TaxID=7936 RepID=A0A0E9UD87_ANGAN